MDYTQKIKLLNELMLNATPQNVDFTPQNGNYCVTLIATRPVHTWRYVVITSRFQCTNHKDKIFFSLSKSFSFSWGDGTMQVRIQSPS